MKTGKRLTALFLALALLLTVAAPGWVTTAHAATTNVGKLSMTYINPLYEDVVTEADLKKPGRPVLYADNRDNEYIYSPEAAGDLIRDDLVNRDETIIVDVFVPYTGDAQSDFENACQETLAWAMIHTGCGVEGDYLQWQYGGWSAGVEDYYLSDDNYLCMSIVFTMTYYTTAAQEAVVTEKVNEVIASLDLTYADAYTKLKAIYDYICANVTYDHKNLNDDSYKLKHSAYAALIDGTAVCQGYALLMYRMALDLGIDCRLIAGDGGGPHGWNIAEIDGLYYNLDSTWDAGRSAYNYFLVCPDNFTDHIRYEEYDTPEFHEYYPMADEDYFYCYHEYDEGIVTVEPTCDSIGWKLCTCTICGNTKEVTIPVIDHIWNDGEVQKEATCTEDGSKKYTCTVCGGMYFESLPALGHDYETVTVAPTCTENGTITNACTRCNEGTTEVIPATGHSHDDGVVTQTPTCTAEGVMTYTCTVCGDSVTEAISKEPHNYVNGSCTACGTSQITAPSINYCYSQKQDSMRVNWTQVAGADGYELWRTATPDDDTSWVRTKTIKDGATTNYTNQGLVEGTTYYYKVRAFIGENEEERIYSEFSAMDYMPAAVVFDSSYSNADFRIRLRWQEVSGAHGYQIWRKDANNDWTIVKTLGDKGNELTNNQGATTVYSNTGLEAGEAYTYKMRAFRITEDGRKVFGTFSDEYVIATMPTAPTVQVESVKAGRANISWDVLNAAGYQIWMADASGEFKIVKSLTDNTINTYTKYDLVSGETYTFKVRAYSEVAGQKTFGSYSDEVKITVK